MKCHHLTKHKTTLRERQTLFKLGCIGLHKFLSIRSKMKQYSRRPWAFKKATNTVAD